MQKTEHDDELASTQGQVLVKWKESRLKILLWPRRKYGLKASHVEHSTDTGLYKLFDAAMLWQRT